MTDINKNIYNNCLTLYTMMLWNRDIFLRWLYNVNFILLTRTKTQQQMVIISVHLSWLMFLFAWEHERL